MGQNCSKKYIALGRVIQHWPEIIGKDLAAQAQPAKMHYRKAKDGKTPEATLEIATTPAHATSLHYRKDLILQKINAIFGDGWITGIKFTAAHAAPSKTLKRKPAAPPSPAAKQSLNEVLESLEDEEMKMKLEKLGEAVINTGR